MPLIPFNRMLAVALDNNFSVGYFQAWNQDSLEAILEAAEESDSPVVLGFGGTPVNQEWFNRCGLEYYAALGRVAVEKSKVPVCFILNEAETYEQCLRGIELGFNVVMLDSSGLPFRENLEVTKKLTKAAHAEHVAVQGELGNLPDGEDTRGAVLTDLREAEEFVRETGIDALSVSVGNVHVLTKGSAQIDINLIKNIRDCVRIPLVIHGGTGFPKDAVKDATDAGVALFHVGSILKIAYYQGLKDSMSVTDELKDIQLTVGSRENEDFTIEGKKRIKNKVIELMKLYSSMGKAGLYS